MFAKTAFLCTMAAVAICGCLPDEQAQQKAEDRVEVPAVQDEANIKENAVQNDKPGKPRVEMVTSKGTIVIELEPEAAPVTVKNFLEYVDSGHFAGTIFHRVIPGFVIQGGGLDENLVPKATRPPIVNECRNGLKNLRGTLSMARTNDLNSATCQFFVNLVDNVGLDYPNNGGYAVFGSVVEGMEVVDAIARLQRGIRRGMQDVPLETVKIESARVLE